MIFGYVLLNDWSARDIQAWEYQPLGPFQAKATATTISPWIVTTAALEPFRVPTPPRERDAPALSRRERARCSTTSTLTVTLAPEGKAASTIARTNYREMYYSARPATRPSHHLRLPDERGRPARLRHHLRPREVRTRLAARTQLGRQGADHPRHRRDTAASSKTATPSPSTARRKATATSSASAPAPARSCQPPQTLTNAEAEAARPLLWSRNTSGVRGQRPRSDPANRETHMAKAFASQGDMTEKKISFTEIGRGLWAFTAEGDPNSGVIIGDDSVMIVEAQATPRLAQQGDREGPHGHRQADQPRRADPLPRRARARRLGLRRRPDHHVGDAARAMVVERGQEDWDSEFQRFPRLFEGHEIDPRPHLADDDLLRAHDRLSRQAPGRPDASRPRPYRRRHRGPRAGRRTSCSPATSSSTTPPATAATAISHDWPDTLDSDPRASTSTPSRRAAATRWSATRWSTPPSTSPRDFVRSTYRPAARVAARGGTLKEAWDAVRAECDPKFADYAIYEHCLPFNVARAYDEAPRHRHARGSGPPSATSRCGRRCRADRSSPPPAALRDERPEAIDEPPPDSDQRHTARSHATLALTRANPETPQ